MKTEKQILKLKKVIPEIDIDGAIENYTGTPEFYLEMLADWVNSSCFSDFEKALEAKDYQSCRLSMHSLKGLSRAVGLNREAALAEKLQFACDKNDYEFLLKNGKEYLSLLNETRSKAGDVILPADML